jgi:1-acyl-sn-glycerol-3-phosphate acyltransferase
VNSTGPAQRSEYRFPALPLVPFAFHLLFARRRSFAHDGELVLAKNPFSRCIEGLENVPETGSFILTANHFNREGLHPYHCALMISALVARRRPGLPELSWAFTSEWYGRRIGPLPVPVGLTRWVFRRIGAVYDLTVLPRRPEMVVQRAVALRQFAATLSKRSVAIMPEGVGRGKLVEPATGSGLFLSTLSTRGYPVLPVALFEEEGALVIRFGEPYRLSTEEGLSREEGDAVARERMMVAIGRLLPRRCWGAYADAIESQK